MADPKNEPKRIKREQLFIENRDFTVNSLREKWFGEDKNKRTLIGVFRSRIMDFEKLVLEEVLKIGH